MNNHLYIENNDINESSYKIEIFTENTKIRDLIIKEFMQYLFIELLHEIIHIRKYYINGQYKNMLKNIDIDDTYIQKKNVIIKPFYNKLSIFYINTSRIFNYKLKYSYRLPLTHQFTYCDNIIQPKIYIKIINKNTICNKKKFLQICYSLKDCKCTLLCTTDLDIEQDMLIDFLCKMFIDINRDNIITINGKLIITFICSFNLHNIKQKLLIFKKLANYPEIFLINVIKGDIIPQKIESCNLVSDNHIGFNTYDNAFFLKDGIINQIIYPNYNGYLFMLMYPVYTLQTNIFINEDSLSPKTFNQTDVIVINQVMFENLLDYTGIWIKTQNYILLDLHEPPFDYKKYTIGKFIKNPFVGNVQVNAVCIKTFLKYVGFSEAVFITENTSNESIRPKVIEFQPEPYIYQIQDISQTTNMESKPDNPNENKKDSYNKKLLRQKRSDIKKVQNNYQYIQYLFILSFLTAYMFIL